MFYIGSMFEKQINSSIKETERGANTSLLVAGLIVGMVAVHDHVLAVEIPENASWEEGLNIILEAQNKEKREQLSMAYIMESGEIRWLPIAATRPKNTVLSIGNIRDDIEQHMSKLGGEGVQEAILIHSHPGDEYLTTSPSGDDIGHLWQYRDVYRDLPFDLNWGVVINQGFYYYGFLPDEDLDSLYGVKMRSVLDSAMSTLSPDETQAIYDVIITGMGASAEDYMDQKDVIVRYFLNEPFPGNLSALFFKNNRSAGQEYRRIMDFLNTEERFRVEDFSPDVAYALQGKINRWFADARDIKRLSWGFLDMEGLSDIYRLFGFDCRFVPDSYVKHEVPISGLKGDHYVYQNNQWEIKVKF